MQLGALKIIYNGAIASSLLTCTIPINNFQSSSRMIKTRLELSLSNDSIIFYVNLKSEKCHLDKFYYKKL